jgi:cytochrome c oxidase subunit 1
VIARCAIAAKTQLCATIAFVRRHPGGAVISVLAAALGGAAVVVIGALFIAWLGVYDVAATAGHAEPVAWFLHFTMRNSVKAHAPDLPVPPLDDASLIEKGRRYADFRCAPCHRASGRSADVVAQAMVPAPPNISTLANGFDPDQLHWIVKHGIKMSAMPPWPARRRDDEIWPLVAYLEHENKSPGDEGAANVSQGPGLGGRVTENTCFACHGSAGNGSGGVFPKLAGLGETYIEQSLKDYRDGTRESGFMKPFAGNLSDEEIKSFANYFGNLTRQPEQQAASEDGLFQLGADIAEPARNARSVPACQTCHTRENPKLFSSIPDLAGQSADYLRTQLTLFRSGIRAGTENARIMARIAHDLSDRDIEAVSAYFARLPVRPSQGVALPPSTNAVPAK